MPMPCRHTLGGTPTLVRRLRSSIESVGAFQGNARRTSEHGTTYSRDVVRTRRPLRSFVTSGEDRCTSSCARPTMTRRTRSLSGSRASVRIRRHHSIAAIGVCGFAEDSPQTVLFTWSHSILTCSIATAQLLLRSRETCGPMTLTLLVRRHPTLENGLFYSYQRTARTTRTPKTMYCQHRTGSQLGRPWPSRHGARRRQHDVLDLCSRDRADSESRASAAVCRMVETRRGARLTSGCRLTAPRVAVPVTQAVAMVASWGKLSRAGRGS